MVTGETSTGKTSLIEQACIRLNWPFKVLSCHERTTVDDVIGGMQLIGGNTVWVDGTLIEMMRVGGVWIGDEINLAPAGALAGLNLVCERFRFTIPATGEVVVAHPDFRIAVTGNSLNGDNRGAYKGTNKMNMAFMNRFVLGCHVGYLKKEQEVALLRAKYPELDENLTQYVVEVADMSRKMCKDGSVSAHPISPRQTIAMGAKFVAFGHIGKDQEEVQQYQFSALPAIMKMSYLWALNPSEKKDFIDSMERLAKTLSMESKIRFEEMRNNDDEDLQSSD